MSPYSIPQEKILEAINEVRTRKYYSSGMIDFVEKMLLNYNRFCIEDMVD